MSNKNEIAYLTHKPDDDVFNNGEQTKKNATSLRVLLSSIRQFWFSDQPTFKFKNFAELALDRLRMIYQKHGNNFQNVQDAKKLGQKISKLEKDKSAANFSDLRAFSGLINVNSGMFLNYSHLISIEYSYWAQNDLEGAREKVIALLDIIEESAQIAKQRVEEQYSKELPEPAFIDFKDIDTVRKSQGSKIEYLANLDTLREWSNKVDQKLGDITNINAPPNDT